MPGGSNPAGADQRPGKGHRPVGQGICAIARAGNALCTRFLSGHGVKVTLRQVAGAGKGVVVVLHDLALASRFCSRLVVLAKGRKILDGPPADLTDDVIRRAYGVSTLRGEYLGQTFVLPWAPLDREG